MILANSTTSGVCRPPEPPLQPNSPVYSYPHPFEGPSHSPHQGSDLGHGLAVFTPSCCSTDSNTALPKLHHLASYQFLLIKESKDPDWQQLGFRSPQSCQGVSGECALPSLGINQPVEWSHVVVILLVCFTCFPRTGLSGKEQRWGLAGRTQGMQIQKVLVLVLLHENGSSHSILSFTPFFLGWLLCVLKRARLPHGFAFSRDDGHTKASPWPIHRKSGRHPSEPHPLLGSRGPERSRLTSGQRPPPLWNNSTQSGGSWLISNK